MRQLRDFRGDLAVGLEERVGVELGRENRRIQVGSVGGRRDDVFFLVVD